jgi:putative dimethyl sulfoxide reductase chaperone
MCGPTSMPTPFEEPRSGKVQGRTAAGESPDPERELRNEEWAARTEKPRRSVFGNYPGKDEKAGVSSPAADIDLSCGSGPGSIAPLDAARTAHSAVPTSNGDTRTSLQTAIDTAMARSFIYRFLAQAYQDPTEEGWHWLCAADCQASFKAAVRAPGAATSTLVERAGLLAAQFKPESFEQFLTSYLAAFGHAARGRCPLNEIEYGDIKADPLFQPHRLADLAAFYRAFGLEAGEDADERQDHICLELEFLCVLTAKEAYALEHQLDPEDLEMGRDAQRSFLREHLGRWIPAFTRRLARLAGDGALGALANLTGAFVEAECARFGITPGSEDLLLRPVDAAADSMCGSCGLSQRTPGALAPTEP